MTITSLIVFRNNELADAEKVNQNFETIRQAINNQESSVMDANIASEKIGKLYELETADKSSIIAAINEIIQPAGIVIVGATASPPTGFLLCNGAKVSRQTYAKLFKAIGTTWGEGDGSLTFALPDFRGVFLRGVDSSRGLDSGRAFASYQADDFKSHNHTLYNSGSCGADPRVDNNPRFSNGDHRFQSYPVVPSSGYTGGSETRPKNTAVHYYIKY